MTRSIFRIISLLLPFTRAFLHAQQLATLNVTVTDPSGSILSGPTVSLTASATGVVRAQSTNHSGVAVPTALPAGEYRLSVIAKGFSLWQHSVTLSVGQVAAVSTQLDLASVKQSVTVAGISGENIETRKTESSQVIRPNQIADLPISGRDFIDLVLLTPTVNVGRSTATAAQSPFQESVLQLSFGGLRETHSSFFGLDGTDYTVSLSGVQHVSPSLDWVQEFRVVDGPCTADNGRNLGSVVNTITKFGTNAMHGSVYEYFRNGAIPIAAHRITTAICGFSVCFS